MPKRQLSTETIEQFTNEFFDQLERFVRSPLCFDVLMRLSAISAHLIFLRAQRINENQIFPSSVRQEFADSFKKLDRENFKKIIEYMKSVSTGEPERSVLQPMLQLFENIRSASAALARGRKSLDELWEQAYELKQKGYTWGQVARQLTPEKFREDSHLATKRIQSGVRRWRKRKALTR